MILVSASTVTLGAGWLAGAGYGIDSGSGTATVPSSPGPGATETDAATSAPSTAPTETATGPVTVDGAVVDTKYGTVQVQVVVEADAIVDLIAVKLTDSSETSVEVSARAAPILREEILAAQSTEVGNVSGATYTSEAYRSSVQSALDAIGSAE
ncbi:FMN-binding protein [Agromyces sp. GXS1127]|uniref:FMN-binding protein n=1 Tax=Agromyces sp. GXS1127 TaxID=3424181 RepID=UPI003D314C74